MYNNKVPTVESFAFPMLGAVWLSILPSHSRDGSARLICPFFILLLVVRMCKIYKKNRKHVIDVVT